MRVEPGLFFDHRSVTCVRGENSQETVSVDIQVRDQRQIRVVRTLLRGNPGIGRSGRRFPWGVCMPAEIMVADRDAVTALLSPPFNIFFKRVMQVGTIKYL